jgi:hypothetical protein
VLDPDLLGRVLEDMEASHTLSKEFSEKLRSKLNRAGLTEESLEQLCRTLGDSASGTLRADGLRELLLIIGFHISDSKFARLFRVLGEYCCSYYCCVKPVLVLKDIVQVTMLCMCSSSSSSSA